MRMDLRCHDINQQRRDGVEAPSSTGAPRIVQVAYSSRVPTGSIRACATVVWTTSTEDRRQLSGDPATKVSLMPGSITRFYELLTPRHAIS